MSDANTVQVLAPAKINLTLHVTGQRSDGYHLLDSLVAFTEIADTLTATAPGNGDFSVSGTFGADVPTDSSNLICKVAEKFWPEANLSFHLHKELPVASGIGGGSADAAASYRAIALLRQISGAGDGSSAQPEELTADLARLGADIPMCLNSETVRVQGIGDQMCKVDDLPTLSIVLVNPGIAVSTPAVFKALNRKNLSAMSLLPSAPDVGDFLTWLGEQRNDLETPACSQVPEIRSVLGLLAKSEGCALARMSGSGATCFGLFSEKDEAQKAADAIKKARPSYWVKASRINGAPIAAPQLIRSTT